MKAELILMLIIFSFGTLVVAGVIEEVVSYMIPVGTKEQVSSNDAKEAFQKMSYFKDQNGNCYAYQPNTPKFSWIPCELTK